MKQVAYILNSWKWIIRLIINNKIYKKYKKYLKTYWNYVFHCFPLGFTISCSFFFFYYFCYFFLYIIVFISYTVCHFFPQFFVIILNYFLLLFLTTWNIGNLFQKSYKVLRNLFRQPYHPFHKEQPPTIISITKKTTNFY